MLSTKLARNAIIVIYSPKKTNYKTIQHKVGKSNLHDFVTKDANLRVNMPIMMKLVGGFLGWKLMSCSHGQELCQLAVLVSDWLFTLVQPIRSKLDCWHNSWQRLKLISFHPWPLPTVQRRTRSPLQVMRGCMSRGMCWDYGGEALYMAGEQV